MSTAKNIGKAVGGFFFLTFLSLMLFAISLSQVTSHDVLQENVAPIFTSELQHGATPAETQQVHAGLLLKCQNGAETVDFQVGEGSDGKTVPLKCSDVTVTSAENLLTLVANALFDKTYYKDYGCDFITCMKTLQGQDKSLVIISSTANKFYSQVWVYLLIIVIVSAIAVFFSAETWPERLKSIGVSMFVAGLPYFIFGFAAKFVPQGVITEAGPITSKIIKLVAPNFLIPLVAGLVLAAIGIVMEHYQTKKLPAKGKP